jgi:hypothetical protein
MSIQPYFIEKITRIEKGLKPMPLFHTCDAYFLKSILGQRQISTTKCPVFKQEELLYLFYGRPAYKSSMKDNTDLNSLLPVTFILNYDKIGPLQRIFPFDTGAFKKGLYNDFFHPRMAIEEFIMKPELDSLVTSVDYFFGQNVSYFDNRPKKEIKYDVLDFTIESYHKLIMNGGRAVSDDRKASFEVQLSHNIPLNNETLLAIIIPSNFEGSEEIENVVVNELKAEILTYKSYGIASDLHYTRILDLTRDFLIKKEFCHEQ